MNDALAVRGVEAPRHLPRHVDRLVRGQRPASVEPFPGGAARHVLGHDEQLALDLLEGMHRGDIRVHQRRGGAGFEPEPLAPRAVGGVLGMQDFQGDGPCEAGIVSEVHDAHPAAPQRANDAVGPHHRARGHPRRDVVEQERRHAGSGVGEEPAGLGVRVQERCHLRPQPAVGPARAVEKRRAVGAAALPRLVEQRGDAGPAVGAFGHR